MNTCERICGMFFILASAMTSVSLAQSPSLTASPSFLSFNGVIVGKPSDPKSYTLDGKDLANDITVTVPDPFEVSTTSFGGFSRYLTINRSTLPATIYVRYSPTSSSLNTMGEVSNASYPAQTVNVQVSGIPLQPALVGGGSLNFGTVAVGTESRPLPYSLSGSNIGSNVQINAPDGFMVSSSSGFGFAASLTLQLTGSNLSSILVYVKFKPTRFGNFGGNIVNTVAGASPLYVVVSGSAVQPMLSVTLTDSLEFQSVKVGKKSRSKSFFIAGRDLTGDAEVDAPPGFEVSTDSLSHFGGSLKIDPVGGDISNRQIFVRCSPRDVWLYKGEIVVKSPGAEEQRVTVSGRGTK
jgi:hypothetical protein